jgi:hypothetical protein
MLSAKDGFEREETVKLKVDAKEETAKQRRAERDARYKARKKVEAMARGRVAESVGLEAGQG